MSFKSSVLVCPVVEELYVPRISLWQTGRINSLSWETVEKITPIVFVQTALVMFRAKARCVTFVERSVSHFLFLA